jgi:secreted Zn-dependent insulinase-like peptidase
MAAVLRGSLEGGSILQSESDKRHYRYFQMENEISVLVISDPEMRSKSDTTK